MQEIPEKTHHQKIVANRYKEAIAIQYACNIGGVTATLRDTVVAMFRATSLSTQEIMADPAIRLMVYKLATLCNVTPMSLDDFTYCADQCRNHIPVPQPKPCGATGK